MLQPSIRPGGGRAATLADGSGAAYADPRGTIAYIAFGANIALDGLSLSDAVLRAADLLEGADCRMVARSRLFATPCFPAGVGPDYVNAVAACMTTLEPAGLLKRMHEIEAELGRERVQRWGSRTMDLDLLAHGAAVLPDIETYRRWHDLPPDQQPLRAPDRLILPHPRMCERAFVLIPMLDVAPGWRHPVSGITLRQMVEALPEADKSAVCPL